MIQDIIKKTHTVVQNVTYDELFNVLNDCDEDQEIVVEYNKYVTKSRSRLIDSAITTIQSLKLSDICGSKDMKIAMSDIIDEAKGNERRLELYTVRKKDGIVEENKAGYLLFNQGEEIKSVERKKLISIYVDGTRLVR